MEYCYIGIGKKIARKISKLEEDVAAYNAAVMAYYQAPQEPAVSEDQVPVEEPEKMVDLGEALAELGLL